MKTIYKGHLPGSLGMLEVLLSPSDGIQALYTAPGAKSAKDVGNIQAAVDADFAEDDVVNRLNYASHLNTILVSKIKAARKEEDPPSRPPRVQDPPTGSQSGAGLIPITAENVGDLPDNIRPETRRKIFERLGIDDPKK